MELEALKQMHDKRGEFELVDEILNGIVLDEQPKVSFVSPEYLRLVQSWYLNQ